MSHPHLLTSTREPLDIELNVKQGVIPKDLSGFVFINSGAGTVNSGGLPYERNLPNGDFNQEFGSPMINGDSYMFRFDFTESGKVKLKTDILKPPCYYADLATSPYLNGEDSRYADLAFKNQGIARMSMKLGTRNQLNTAITPFKYPGENITRVLATFDAARPFEFNPENLDLITAIGENKFWRAGTPPFLNNPFPMVLTSAHPVYDPVTEEVFSVNFTKTTETLLKATDIFDLIFKDEKEFERKLEEKVERWRQYDDKKKAVKELNDFFFEAQTKPKKKNLWDWLKELYWKLIGRRFSNENAVYLVRWKGERNPEAFKIVNEDGSNIEIQHNMHQLGFSEDYVLLADTNFKFTLDVMLNNPFPNNKKIDEFLRDLLDGAQNDYSTLYIVPRDQIQNPQTPVKAFKVVLPVETVHFSANYKNPDGVLTIHTAHNCSACPAEWIRYYDTKKCTNEPIDPQMVGLLAVGEMDVGQIGKIKIDVPNRNVLEDESKFLHLTGNLEDYQNCGPHTWGVGLYTYNGMLSADENVDEIKHIFWQAYGLSEDLLTDFMYDLYKSPERHRIYSAEQMLEFTKKEAPFVLQTVDTDSMNVVDYYNFGRDEYMWSLQFVPSSTKKNDISESLNGYILCAVIGKEDEVSTTSYFSDIWIFKAWDLKAGPICKLGHEKLQFAFTIHSVWVKEASSVPQPPYKINVREDYEEQIKHIKRRWLRRKVQSLMKEHVYPHFR